MASCPRQHIGDMDRRILSRRSIIFKFDHIDQDIRTVTPISASLKPVGTAKVVNVRGRKGNEKRYVGHVPWNTQTVTPSGTELISHSSPLPHAPQTKTDGSNSCNGATIITQRNPQIRSTLSSFQLHQYLQISRLPH
jgi:hypothetical protein